MLDASTTGLYTLATQFDFHPRVRTQRGPALLFFTKLGCGSCGKWKLLLKDFIQYEPVAVFEVDAAEDAALAREFAVFHLPALFLFKDGEYHAALECEASLPRLRETLLTLLALPAQEAP